jgi:hypothetical protein
LYTPYDLSLHLAETSTYGENYRNKSMRGLPAPTKVEVQCAASCHPNISTRDLKKKKKRMMLARSSFTKSGRWDLESLEG